MVIARAGRRLTDSGAVFGFAVGVLVGALVAALFVPGRQRTTSFAAQGRGGTTGLSGGGSGLASSAAGPGGGAGGVAGGVTGGDGAGGTASGTASAGSPSAAGGAADSVTVTIPGTAGASGPAASAVRGVTANAVTIGIAYVDLGPVAYLGPQYSFGDVQQEWSALIDGWKRAGLLPIAGRTVNLVFSKFSVLDTTQENATCTTLVQDDKAFAIVAPQYFYQYGDECVTAQYHTPLITTDGAPDNIYAAGAPYLFTVMSSEDNLLQNWIHWAQDRGYLKGRKIGVYYLDDPQNHQLVDKDVKGTLAQLGYSVAAEATTNSGSGGPNDALAVQKFRAAGVNLALLMTSNLGFQEQAQAQGYYPKYIDSDFNGDTTYLGANDYPTQEYDSTYAVTEQRHGEYSAGMPPPAAAGPCLQNYERYTGQRVPTANETNGTWVYVMYSCDLGSILLHALQAAGANLTPQRFIAGIESFRNQPMIMFPQVSFGPGDHEGVHEQRTLQWHAGCKCWVAQGAFTSLDVQPPPSG